MSKIPMSCEEVRQWLPELSDRQLDQQLRRDIEAHCEICEGCAAERAALEELSGVMERMPLRQPSPALRHHFLQMLEEETKAATPSRDLRTTRLTLGRVIRPLVWQAAAACMILAAGVGIGVKLTTPARPQDPQLVELKQEVRDMKQTLMLSLLNEESASQRIKAVNYVEDMAHPDTAVINALVSTLNHDKNVNVRLASLYSLARFADERPVRDALVSALPQQSEPLVQIVLINLLAEKREKRAIPSILSIMANDHTLPDVRTIAEKGLKTM